MANRSWSIAEQQKRRDALYEAYLPVGLRCFDETGEFVGEGEAPRLRERLWHCLGLYAGDGDARRLADTIVLGSARYQCHFSPSVAQLLLFRHGEAIGPEATQWLRGYVREYGTFLHGCFFNGYNDNQPSLAAFTCLAYGEMFDDAEMRQRGLDGLQVARDLLQRNAFLSEFNSPTYTPISAMGMALIVNHVREDRAVTLARDIEARVWAEMVAHWHTPTSMLAGPSARSYMVDSSGGISAARMLFGHVFGEVCFADARTCLFPGPKEMEHHSSLAFMQASAVWHASVDYHVPDEVGAAIFERSLPDTVTGTRDGGEGKHVRYIHHPETNTFTPVILSPHRDAACYNPVTTYLTEDYSLGTAARRYGTGAQCDVLFATYRRRNRPRNIADVGTVFPRYIINEKKPGQANFFPCYGRQYERNLLASEGTAWAMQKDGFALLMSWPNGLQHQGIFSLKQAAIIPCLFGQPEEIWLGDRRLDGFAGQSEGQEQVFIRDGEVFMALTALTSGSLDREAAVTLALENGYGVISFYDYYGTERNFGQDEIVEIRSGFAFEVASAPEVGSFEQFRLRAAEMEIVDNFSADVRHLRVLHNGNDFHAIYSPHTEGVRCATINGKPIPTAKFQTRAFDVTRLPFMEQEWVPESLDWYRRLYPDR